MVKRLPGTQQPSIIKPKSIVKVGPRGKVQTASIVRHPAPVERIWSIHRNAQHALANISRKANANLLKKR